MKRVLWIAGGCVVAFLLVLLLAPRTSYEPGPLMAVHEQLSGRCQSCHEPWHPISNQGCINCHGDYADLNPHGDVNVFSPKHGLMPGRTLTAFSGNLECLTCHTEHNGRKVNLKLAAAFACTYCHEHPSIDKVRQHMVPVMMRQKSASHLLKQPFNHREHEGLISLEDPPRSGACTTCHLVVPTKPGQPDEMKIKWSGCAGSDCHVHPQDQYIQMPASIGPSPKTLPYTGVVKVRYINAVFNHSPAHLRFKCAVCHFEMKNSTNPDDADSLAIKQCFTCHAHQPMKASETANASSVWSGGVAMAAEAPAQKRVVACGQCHLFHTYGPVLTNDFPTPPPKFPPHSARGFVLTAYIPAMIKSANGGKTLGLRAVELSPWGIGIAAIFVIGIGFIGYIRFIPATEIRRTATEAAPQRIREIPDIDDTFQTSIPNLYIVGEAAGTASINLAMRTGRVAIEVIAAQLRLKKPPVEPDVYDVAVVGCGPAGLGATATAKSLGLNYVTLEKMTPASTIRSYPRGKFVQATPIDILEYGSFFLEGDNSKEGLIAMWDTIIGQAGLVVNDREEVVSVKPQGDRFVVSTAKGHDFTARYVVLAIGVRGNPRRLGLPGEAPERVFYNLIEPQDFKDKNVLVVGGGNAGAEVAQALAAPELRNRVSYSIRDATLSTVTRENAEKITNLQQENKLALYPLSALTQIKSGKIVLEPVKASSGSLPPSAAAITEPTEIDNDVIFAMIGAELPTRFFKAIGIRMTAKGRKKSA